MKTTLNLPDDLMREVKVRAARENRRLQDVLAEFIRRGLQARPESDRRRGKLPVSSVRGGIRGGVDLNDSRSLLQTMER
jgi:plasmid stability protein